MPERQGSKGNRRSTIRCSIVRGGTSKGVFLFAEELPPPGAERDEIIKRIMGTPDPRQIDGLGGADILTSKVAILSPSARSDADVDYTFAQVGIEQDLVRYDGNCGNISAAVGPVAIEAGFVQAQEPLTHVRIHNTNIQKIIHAEIPVAERMPLERGDYRIDGVPGSGARIVLDFRETVGSLTGRLLPTGNPVDTLDIDGLGRLRVSIVDVANPVVFVRAGDLGYQGTESPDEIDSDTKRLDLCEAIRGKAAELLGFVDDGRRAFEQTPYVPFFILVAPPRPYGRYRDGKVIRQEEIDLLSRLIGFKRTHKAFPGTGGVCLAATSRIPGTLVADALEVGSNQSPMLRIGHPSGVMEVEIEADSQGNPKRAAYGSTWRRIMDGQVFIPERPCGFHTGIKGHSVIANG